jgi:exonuclease SbcD
MRFIHTADWHLGRLFHTVHLTDDQRYVLDQFVDLVADVRPAAVLVAGDIYDRGVPPTDAVELLNDVLQRIVRGLGVPVVMIAGNHDSPARLGFGAELLAGEGLHVAGGLPTAGALYVPLVDDDGVVLVQAIPYADPVEVRAALDDPDVQTHEQAMAALLARAREAAPRDGRGVLVAHAFVAGADTSDSERPLTVGGAGTVPAALFDGFDYVALGHLHRPQTAGADAVRYAGSLLTYSFDEAAQTKSVSVVEIGAPGSALLATAGSPGALAEAGAAGGAAVAAPPALARLTVEQVELRPRRRVRVLQGTLDDILRRALTDTARDDYVCARLTDPGAVLNAMAQLQQAYPNCLHLEFVRDLPTGDRGSARADPTAKTEREHFAEFFELVTDEPLSSAQRERLDAVIAALRRDDREA